MSNKEFKEFLKQLEKDYYNFCFEKDKQSLFYIDQMVDIFYNELIYQVYNKDAFYDLMYNNFKKNISIIFKNMKDYMDKLSKDSLKSINELINVGTTNRYVELDNLVNVYNNFKVEVNKNFNISDKIVTLVNANMNAFAGQLFSKSLKAEFKYSADSEAAPLKISPSETSNRAHISANLFKLIDVEPRSILLT